jgi:hypothetical protein
MNQITTYTNEVCVHGLWVRVRSFGTFHGHDGSKCEGSPTTITMDHLASFQNTVVRWFADRFEITHEKMIEWYGEPTMRDDWDGRAVLIWDMGPDEWAYVASRDITWPEWVLAEPVNHMVLAFYVN